jgi:hypothetical protein
MNRHFNSIAVAMAAMPALAAFALPQENCVFQLAPPEEPYYVLGSRVTPQSSYLVVGRCEKSAEEIRTELVEPARERAEALAKEQARAKQIRAQGNTLVRTRERNTPEESGGLESWWSWMWGG